MYVWRGNEKNVDFVEVEWNFKEYMRSDQSGQNKCDRKRKHE